ncbi:efflux RND transporter periplasmic adaptor subunit [Gemmatimonadota bacterium]
MNRNRDEMKAENKLERIRPMKMTGGAGMLAALILLASAGLSGCTPPAQTAEGTYERVVNVVAMPVVPAPFTSTVRVTGSVEALYDVTVSCEEGGVVEAFLVRKGSRVTRGQPIARIDSDMLAAQLDEARAGARLAQEQWERQKRLWEDQEIGTELAYIQARETAAMRAATVRTMETRLEKKTIRSPVDGTFEDYWYEQGEFAVPGSPFARIVSIDEVKVVGGVAERFAGDIVEGTPVEIAIDNCPDASCTTDISYVGDTVNPDSRTFAVEVILPNPDRIMKPGMIANMLILTERIEDAIIVPQEAVVRSEDGYQVFVVVTEEGRDVSRVRDVILGPAGDDRIVIAEGLAPGDRVVTIGQLKLGNGDLVSVVEPANGTGSSEGEGR